VSNRAQILTIGDELLSGEVVDTHASWLDTRLAAWGWRVIRHSSVLDDVEAIAAALRSAAAEAELVLVSGGLGPTQDDVTLEGLARALGVGLVEHAPTVASLHERASRLGRPLTPGSLRQARVPAVGEVLPNAVGTAPAFVAPLLGAQVFLLPGVPRELRYLAEHVVRPRVERARPAVYRRTLKVIGLGESQLEHALSAALGDHAGVRVGFRTLGAENHLKLAASTPEALVPAVEAARAALGAQVFGEDEETIESVVLAALGARDATLAVAESCTGGMVTERLTSVAGASRVLLGGAVVYANALKVSLTDVPEALLVEHGAVSEAVARALAEGIRARTLATWGLSTTGIAGPGGGTPEKPVGLVWIAASGPGGTTTRELRLSGDREQIRGAAAAHVLELLRRCVTTTG
jgi:nicotinamide-nucleotide amidase